MGQHSDEFLCSQCLNLIQNPVILRCGHSICFDCAAQQFAFQNGMPSKMPINPYETVKITCSDCSTPHEVPKNCDLRQTLTFNRKLNEVVQQLKSSSVAAPSAPPLPVPVHHYSHPSMMFSTSQVTQPTSMSQQYKFCSIHDEPMKILCLDCGDAICYACGMFGQHKGHNSTPISEVAAVLVPKIRDHFQAVNFKRSQLQSEITATADQIDKTTTTHQSVMSSITNTFSGLREYLTELENKLTKEAQKVTSDKLEVLSKHQASLLSQLDKVQSINVNQEIPTQPMAIIDMEKNIKQQRNQLESTVTSRPSTINLSLMIDLEKIKRALQDNIQTKLTTTISPPVTSMPISKPSPSYQPPVSPSVTASIIPSLPSSAVMFKSPVTAPLAGTTIPNSSFISYAPIASSTGGSAPSPHVFQPVTTNLMARYSTPTTPQPAASSSISQYDAFMASVESMGINKEKMKPLYHKHNGDLKKALEEYLQQM